jgi:glycosyltransferase involved in cell wall biosynthesis
VLLFFGYVRDYKGLDVLLDAMPSILRRMKVVLLVVGEFYNDENRYREQAERLGLGEAVRFHSSYVPNEQVGMFFSAADVLTLPYKSATQSGIIQIAYNFHRPVIATDVGGLGEVVEQGRTGALTPPNDPDAFADAVCRFFEEDAFEAYRRNVMEEKKKYSWDYMAQGIEDLYVRSLDAAGIKGNR